MQENNDILLEGPKATWILPLTDGELGGTYTGKFEFKCYLDPLQQLQAGRDYRELLGSLASQATDTEGNLSFALTQLKHRILKAPPFWTSTLQESGMQGNIGDLNIIALVLDAAIRSETMFKEKIANERNTILERSIKIAESKLEKESKEE